MNAGGAQLRSQPSASSAASDHNPGQHLVPLELGGAPRDPGNLWPEPYSGSRTAHSKEAVETKLKNAVYAGSITLSAVPSAIKTSWTTALQVTGIG
ncbi:hypothetical protein [Streptomyces sp. NPDC002676]